VYLTAYESKATRNLSSFLPVQECKPDRRILACHATCVSQQLSAFESEAGVKLFCREANEYRLTETGEALFLLSKHLFLRLGQMEDVLEEARKVGAERLRIGTTKAYAAL